VLAEQFREVMAGVATPVSVITAVSADGVPHGTTVSAFASLSMDPPMVLVSLDRGSDLLALVRETGRFGVNVLGSTQSALALSFARKGPDKFAAVDWVASSGLPRLPGAPGWLACDVDQLVEGGDHVVALGLVRAAATTDGRPLTYHSRVFGTHAALEVSP
jgi:flavin reductase (DIM6/NTAB) family NADH-FMN oxidoreductase RutF